jgi:TolB protein
MPENVLTAAAQMLAATADATRIGTPTALPYNAIVATVTPTTLVVLNTPRPLNAATAYAMAAVATAAALTTGTPTPLPPSAATPTLPPPTPLLVYLDSLPPVPSATPTKVPGSVIPAQLIGKILFTSDRDGDPKLFALDPATGRLAYLTEQWPYNLAKDRQIRSPDGRLVLYVQDRIDTSPQVPGVFMRDNQYQTSRLLVPMNGWSYDPVFSPDGSRVTFVSTEPGNDEIYTIGADGANLRRLTSNDWEWDKHPSFSPDGNQIVFWSNRETGRRQLWIMNADGRNPRRLLNSAANDWNPVWVK